MGSRLRDPLNPAVQYCYDVRRLLRGYREREPLVRSAVAKFPERSSLLMVSILSGFFVVPILSGYPRFGLPFILLKLYHP